MPNVNAASLFASLVNLAIRDTFGYYAPSHDYNHIDIMKKLSASELKNTIAQPVQLTEGQPVFDFWSYFDEIPEEDFDGHDCSKGDIYKVFRMQGNQYEHVLIMTESEDVYMALVNDIEKAEVFGHCLLDYSKIQANSAKE